MPLSNEAVPEFCHRCKSIDWDEAEQNASRSELGHALLFNFSLKAPRDMHPSSCALCRILHYQINAFLRKRLSWQIVLDPDQKAPSSDVPFSLFILDMGFPRNWSMHHPKLDKLIQCPWTRGERFILFVAETKLDSGGNVHDNRAMLNWCALKSSYTILQPDNADSNIMTTLSPASVNYATVREWLRLCSEEHGPVCTPSSLNLPKGFRLIDCKHRRIVDVDTVSAAPEYIALSYLWGRTSWRASSTQVCTSPGLPNLPKVIEDALSVTLNLGFRYLWVDRYCIPEDSHTMRIAQIYSMDTIYSSAQATIVAAVGSGPSVGLPGVGIERFPQPSAHAQGRTFIWSMTPSRDLVKISPWNTRGW
jgi:hypothetical protein